VSFLDKSDDFESFLSLLNDTLEPVFGTAGPTGDSHTSVQITGLPRTGTTILYQLLARTGCVGYVSNLMAFFWRVPTVGATLQRQLTTGEVTLSTSSMAGRTVEPLDPHEFGYFWRAVLGHSANSMVRDLEPWPIDRLQQVLDDVSKVFGAPTVYKNFLVLAHPDEMFTLPSARFLVLERPAIDVAASLVALDRRVGGAAPARLGLQPAPAEQVRDGSLVEQVARQVAVLERARRRAGFERHPAALVVPYRKLCESPRETVGEVLEFIGGDLRQLDPGRLPASLTPGAGATDLAPAERRVLQRLLDEELEGAM
jgi:hypothetical protein